jgi:hypothetical protein
VRHQAQHADYRALVDAKLTELVLYAKELCPTGAVEASAIQYEDEAGRIEVFPPPTLPEAEEEAIERALAERSDAIYASTGLYIPCAVLDPTAR